MSQYLLDPDYHGEYWEIPSELAHLASDTVSHGILMMPPRIRLFIYELPAGKYAGFVEPTEEMRLSILKLVRPPEITFTATDEKILLWSRASDKWHYLFREREDVIKGLVDLRTAGWTRRT